MVQGTCTPIVELLANKRPPNQLVANQRQEKHSETDGNIQYFIVFHLQFHSEVLWSGTILII